MALGDIKGELIADINKKTIGAVTLMSTLETRKVKREQIKIYNRINNMEKALTTKDKELEQYLIKEKME